MGLQGGSDERPGKWHFPVAKALAGGTRSLCLALASRLCLLCPLRLGRGLAANSSMDGSGFTPFLEHTQTVSPTALAWGASGQISSSHGCCTQLAPGCIGCSRLHPPHPPPWPRHWILLASCWWEKLLHLSPWQEVSGLLCHSHGDEAILCVVRAGQKSMPRRGTVSRVAQRSTGMALHPQGGQRGSELSCKPKGRGMWRGLG